MDSDTPLPWWARPDLEVRLDIMERMARSPKPFARRLATHMLLSLSDENEEAFQQALTIMDEEDGRW
jgi:hypothetical protein